MAVTANLETSYGETRALYVRVNNVEASNHGAPGYALCRGFFSQAAFEEGKPFVWEQTVEFTPDVSQPIWAQAYAALKALPEFADAVDA